MNSISIYYLKANLIISVFTLLYYFLLRKETHFHLNRFFLLFGISCALLIPVIRISLHSVQALQFPVNEFIYTGFNDLPINNVQIDNQASESLRIPILDILRIIYFIGITFLSLRFILFLRKLLSLIKEGALRQNGNTFFVASRQKVQPFSYFNFFFFHAEKAKETDFETIVKHEMVHVRQLHSIDLLITEILTILFWFNPFVFLLKNAVRTNHEFLADAAIVHRSTDRLEYLQTLAAQATSHQFGGFGSHFKSSTLKNRIIMITKKKSTLIKSWKYLLVLPVIAILFFSFTSKKIILTERGNLSTTKSVVKHLSKGEIISLPDGTQMNYIGGSSISRISEDKIIISDVSEMMSEKLKFYGDKFEYDSKEKKLTVLGDECFMEIMEKPSTFSFDMSKINLDKINFILPLNREELKRIGSVYGMRIHPILKKKKMHNAIDYVAEKGTPVLAIANGRIRTVDETPENYGKFIIIDHANGFSSLFAQLSEYKVKVGDKVKQGEVIGYVGSSGRSTGPHLHMELKKNGKYVNPEDYLEKD